jgi:hypothetical protein
LRSVGFGVERLGLVAVARPRALLAVVVAVAGWAAMGAFELRFVDDPIALFRSDTAAYRSYAALRAGFADPALDAMVVLEGDFARPAHWRALGEFDRELRGALGAARVASILDVVRLERAAGPSLGDELFGDASRAERAPPTATPAALARHPLNTPPLLAADLATAVIRLDLPDGVAPLAAARSLRAEVAPLLAALPADMRATLTGLPVVRLHVVERIGRQQPWLLGAGLAVGFGLGALLLGRLADAVVVAVVPVFTILALYGTLGHLGLGMTVALNNLPLLILALAFTTSLHLVHAARADLHAAGWRPEALRATMLGVGPAVFLSVVTTALAFCAFVTAGSAELTRFGLIGAATVLSVFVIASLVQPPVIWAALALGWRPLPTARAGDRRGRLWAAAALGLARTVDRRRRAIAVAAGAVAVLAAVGCARVAPALGYADAAPAYDPAVRALTTAAAELGLGAAIQLPLPVDLQLEDAATLTALRAAHGRAAEALPEARILSPWTLVAWLAESGRAVTPARLDALLAAAPAPRRRLVVAADGETPAVLAVLPGRDPARLVAAASALEAAVGDALGADLAGRAAGAGVLAAKRGPEVVRAVGYGLAAAAVAAAVLVAVAFRSARLVPVSLLPNVLPVLVVGAALGAAGAPLRLAGAMALTVALGIAVDGTVHLLNRYRRRPPRRRAALLRSLRELVPVLVITTLVLVLGLAPALLSWSPAVATFAGFAIVTLALALVADLVVLPALLRAVGPPPRVDGARSPPR